MQVFVNPSSGEIPVREGLDTYQTRVIPFVINHYLPSFSILCLVIGTLIFSFSLLGKEF